MTYRARSSGPGGEHFDIQDRVARPIAAVLPTRIHGAGVLEQIARTGRKLSTSEAYLKAIWPLRRTGDVTRAVNDLSRPVGAQETCALADAQLAALSGFLPFTTGRDDPEMVTRSVSHARRAHWLDGFQRVGFFAEGKQTRPS